MQNTISVFSFKSQNVRTQILEAEPWFCLSDVAEILQIQNARQLPLKDQGIQKSSVATKKGTQELLFINEPNLYRVIFRSRKAEAVKFQDWIFEEVIPQIRKTGGYQITPKPTRALPNGLTGEQIEAVKKLHNALTKSAPKEAQARIAITLWSAVKSKFGCSYKEVPAEQFPEVLSVMSRVAVENGVLYGEVLDREPLPAPQPALLDGLDIERFAVTVYYGAWALEMLEEVALPLRQLGHPKATTMHTLWNESRSFLRHNIQALQRVLPALEPDHAAHVRGSLDRLQRLNARFI